MSLLNSYEAKDVDGLSDAEIMMLLSIAKQEAQMLEARKQLKNFFEVRDAEVETIKLN